MQYLKIPKVDFVTYWSHNYLCAIDLVFYIGFSSLWLKITETDVQPPPSFAHSSHLCYTHSTHWSYYQQFDDIILYHIKLLCTDLSIFNIMTLLILSLQELYIVLIPGWKGWFYTAQLVMNYTNFKMYIRVLLIILEGYDWGAGNGYIQAQNIVCGAVTGQPNLCWGWTTQFSILLPNSVVSVLLVGT